MLPPARDPRSDPADAPPESEETVTPRGGFMARPGLKRPPQHAVVVRVGDAPPSEHIPVLRSSVPPPPPADDLTAAPPPEPSPEPSPDSESQKVTLRAPMAAAPTPAPAPASARELARSTALPSSIESAPPPSDMPVVASLPPAATRTQRSRWAIALAAGAGLVLGLASVISTTAGNDAREPLAAAPTPPAASSLQQQPPPPPPVIASEAPAPSAGPPLPKVEPAARPAGSAPRRTIF